MGLRIFEQGGTEERSDTLCTTALSMILPISVSMTFPNIDDISQLAEICRSHSGHAARFLSLFGTTFFPVFMGDLIISRTTNHLVMFWLS
eukprot:g73012.t1